MVASLTRTDGLTTWCEPRFSTPRDLSRESMGPKVGALAARLGQPLMPWQQFVLDVGLELDEDGTYHYDEIVLEAPRQEGKTRLVFSVAVDRLVVTPRRAVSGRRLGRQRITYTAQQRQKARKKLELDFAPLLRECRGFVEVTHIRNKPSRPTEWKLSLNNGAENIEFGRGNFLQIDAPSRTGSHGDTLDVGIIDEAFAHGDDVIETGMSPTMATRPNRQLIVLSTAGDERSFYLWGKVAAGRRACESGDHGRTAYFEWSAPDDADPADPRVWRATSPSLGITKTERFLEGEWAKAVRDEREGGIDLFRRSYLGQWPRVPILDAGGAAVAFDASAWSLAADPGAARGRQVVFGVDVDVDRLAHVAAAWTRPDGRVQVMLTVARSGRVDTRLAPLATPTRLRSLVDEWKGRVILGGPSASLEVDVPRAEVISSADFAAAFGRFTDLLADDQLRHGNQPELNQAVGEARARAFGQSGERSLQLRDAPMVGPLAAVVRAIHGLLLAPRPSPPAPAMGVPSAAQRPSETADLATLAF